MIIGKLDEMIWEYQSKWGFNPKAIIVTPEQMLELQGELVKNLFFGLEIVTNTFPNDRTIKYKGVEVMLKNEVIELWWSLLDLKIY